MKQTSFLVEVVVQDDKPTIIIREPSRGMVVKVTNDPKELTPFLVSVLENLSNPKPAPSSHES